MAITVDKIAERIRRAQRRLRYVHERMEEDYRLWRLENPYRAPKGYQSFASNAPRTLADKIIEVGSGARVDMNIALESGRDAQNKRGQLAEKYVMGVLYRNDMQLQDMLLSPLQASLAWYGTIRGMMAVRVLVYKVEKDGETCFEVMPLDPLHLLYAVGGGGLRWVAYRRFEYLDAVEEEYEVNLPGDREAQYGVYDYWDGEINTALLSESIGPPFAQVATYGSELPLQFRVLKEPEPHGKDKLPFVLVPVQHTPPVVSLGTPDAPRDWAESCYAANRKIYEVRNRLDSWTMDVIERGRRQPAIVKSPDGRFELEQDIYLGGAEVNIPNDAEIRLLELPIMPSETNVMRARLDIDNEQGGLPGISYGQQRYEASGEALAILAQGQMSVIAPLMKALENTYRGIAHALVGQFTEGYQATMLSGYDRSGKRFAGQTVKPSDVGGSWAFNINVAPTLAAEERTRWIMAEMAKKLGISEETILEDILKLQDSSGEHQKIWRQRALEAVPLLGYMEMAKAMFDAGDKPGAKIVLTQLKAMVEATMPVPEAAGPPGQPPMGPPGLPPGMPPGMPPRPPGVPFMPGQGQGPPMPPIPIRR